MSLTCHISVGAAKTEDQSSEEQHIQDLQTALQKLPRVHLLVLDTLIKHLREFVFIFIVYLVAKLTELLSGW